VPTQSQQPDNLRAAVIDRFSRIATTPNQERKFPFGPESAKTLGYEPAEVDALPFAVTESFCGVGNPFSLGEPEHGHTVIDLGCGAGFDTLLAARRVGINGRVIGVDLTPEMIGKARYNAALLRRTTSSSSWGRSSRCPCQTPRSIW
jgi:arsenite methyltransferase